MWKTIGVMIAAKWDEFLTRIASRSRRAKYLRWNQEGYTPTPEEVDKEMRAIWGTGYNPQAKEK